MIRRVLRVALLLGAGAGMVGALYWGFLNTPESRVPTLALSAILALLAVLLAAVLVNAAVLLALGHAARGAASIAARRVHWSLAAVAIVALAGWGATRWQRWIADHSGEISAWFISTFDWSDATPLLQAATYLGRWVQWVLVPVAMVAAVACGLQQGARAVGSLSWIRAAWHWKPLLIATAAFVVLVALPLRLAFWRPAGLPPNWIEGAVAGLRLSLVAALIAIGAAVMVTIVARAVETTAAERG
jgi:hypothetical protein